MIQRDGFSGLQPTALENNGVKVVCIPHIFEINTRNPCSGLFKVDPSLLESFGLEYETGLL